MYYTIRYSFLYFFPNHIQNKKQFQMLISPAGFSLNESLRRHMSDFYFMPNDIL